METTKLKSYWISIILFALTTIALINRHTALEVFKWYYFTPILIVSLIIGGVLSVTKLFRILIFFGFLFLLYKNYFLLKDSEMAASILIILLAFFIVLNLLRAFIYITRIPYLNKNIGQLTILEIKASRGTLSNKEALRLFSYNFFGGVWNLNLIILSAILTFLVKLIFL